MNVSLVLRRSVRAHVLWSTLMIAIALLAAVLDGSATRPTSFWLPLAVVVAIVIFIVTYPINAIGFAVIWGLRTRTMLSIIAAAFLACIWFGIGALIGDRGTVLNETAVWLGVGGAVFGLAAVSSSARERRS